MGPMLSVKPERGRGGKNPFVLLFGPVSYWRNGSRGSNRDRPRGGQKKRQHVVV